MPGTIAVEKLRNVQRLLFEIPQQGVWLLTAENGAGKTTLLACLRRIGNKNAFPLHFPSSLVSDRLDNFIGSSVKYQIDGQAVTYSYRGTRWVPRPKRNSRLLERFGYPSVIYVGANAERITPRSDDFAPVRTRPASPEVIAAANRIFETTKFEQLRTINLSRGTGNRAYLLKVADDPMYFHSEKHFSLGELCVIKLIESIGQCPNQSLILIDELEMALHPRAQIQLYRYLLDIAAVKNLTVIFSTHSISLLKSVKRESIIYLDKKVSGDVDVLKGCYPTYAIGSLTLGEERAPDRVFYVEDDVAQWIVESLCKIIMKDQFDDVNLFPDVRVVPIGGFEAVVKFLATHGMLLPAACTGFAILDQDVRQETVANWEAEGRHDRLAEFDAVREQIDYLPWTPEVGIVEYARVSRADFEQRLRERFGNLAGVVDQNHFAQVEGLAGVALRNQAKRIYRNIVDGIAQNCRLTHPNASKAVCEIFAQAQFQQNRGQLLNLFMPKLR